MNRATIDWLVWTAASRARFERADWTSDEARERLIELTCELAGLERLSPRDLRRVASLADGYARQLESGRLI